MGKKSRRLSRHSSSGGSFCSPPNNTGGLYAEYKMATESFKGMLAKMTNMPITTVGDIERAAGVVVEQEQPVPSALLENINTAIRVRELVTRSFLLQGNETDEGHGYMVSVLKYCRDLLKPLVVMPLKRKDSSSTGSSPTSIAIQQQENEDEEDVPSSRFAALEVEDDESDDGKDDNDEKEPTTRLPRRPKLSIQEEEISIDKLIVGDDYFRAATFLVSLDHLMELVDAAWKQVKTKWRQQRSANKPCFELLLELSKATVITNTTIQHVHHLEQVLAMEVPHLKSFYHCLAVLVFRQHMAFFLLLADTKQDVSHEILDCVAELIREGFCRMSFADAYMGPVGKKVAKELVQITKIPLQIVQSKVNTILFHSACEVLAEPEEAIYRDKQEECNLNTEPQTWLKQFQFIGGGRSLLNTHHLVHAETLSLQKGSMFGSFGDLWEEQSNPASRIRGDLDQLLVGEILPRLWINVKRGWLGDGQLYLKKEMLPLFDILSATRDKDNVPVALSFGIHCILTSILNVQGDDDVKSITVHSKLSFTKFFEQIEDCYLSDLPWPTAVKSYLSSVVLATKEMLKEEGNTKLTSLAALRGFWNPCCAGMFITHASFVSLYLGSNVMDVMMQTRITLHLYHALLSRDLIRGDIPLLKLLYDLLGNAQSLFPGGRPAAGNFAKFCGVAMGLRLDSAAGMAEMKKRAKTVEEQMLVNFLPSKTRQTKERQGLQPGDFGQSYRFICLQDLREMPPSKPGSTNSFFHELADRVQFAITAVEKEKDILRVNFVVVAEILNSFVYRLVDDMGWHDQIKLLLELSAKSKKGRTEAARMSSEVKERLKTATLVLDLLADLDRGSLEKGKKAAESMDRFFGDEELKYTFY